MLPNAREAYSNKWRLSMDEMPNLSYSTDVFSHKAVHRTTHPTLYWKAITGFLSTLNGLVAGVAFSTMGRGRTVTIKAI